MKEEQPYHKKSFSEVVGEKEERRIEAQHEKKSVWAGLGLFGMVGWSVAVPALLGAALGIWLDNKYKESFSWTLTFLITGLMIGCLIAWNWVQKENKEMHKKNEDENE
ncbi:MAG TPA: AtpZ/AtpI family protein [Hanamia sp.]|nr:AtpZ/AtpI family protein [Hanamia sp.]